MTDLPEDLSIKRIAAGVATVLVLAAGMNLLLGAIFTQAEGERSVGAAYLQSIEADIRANDMRDCEMLSWREKDKEAAIFTAFHCLRDRDRKALLRQKKTAGELVK